VADRTVARRRHRPAHCLARDSEWRPPLLVRFSAGEAGAWLVDSIAPIVGESLPPASHVAVLEGPAVAVPHAPHAWALSGVVSSLKYATRADVTAMNAKGQPATCSRAEDTLAALIPIRKSEAWWALTQDERMGVMRAGAHFELGTEYLPAVARRLHHCRELGAAQPFDFLTFFTYAPAEAGRFDEMLRRLRATPEWAYVEREVDVRLHLAV